MTARKFSSTSVPLLAAAAVALFIVPSTQAATVPRVHTVIIDRMKFGAVPTGVRSGDTILWVNKDLFKHTATARDKSFNVVLPPQSSGKIVIRRTGSIAFSCTFHPGMKGVLNVAK